MALYVSSNQLHRQPQFHGGEDGLDEPFVIFRYPLDAEAIEDR